MKFLEMSELVRQHHDHMGQTEIRKLLNRAINDFAVRTKVVQTSFTFEITESNKDDRWIWLDDDIIDIERVEVDNYVINRLIGMPIRRDFE
tara:strand:+ start:10546 stop:10818 length:273 start_codon:yes stop_codon:yes gene_type:complete